MSRHANMSNFVPYDIQQDLWQEILHSHWTFLETEESINKLEERKKLEGCLKKFLSLASHDRKFFLPETAHVLRNTVCGLKDFTAQNAIVGFEAISQYANNLFTKPWRKEFRVLKTYSGSYQHEVESNLIDADKLLLAMGYHRIAEDTFVLDGPICPDQVTNVSRDAMSAYVECQIMKHIHAGLNANGFSCSWQDIFHYRERHVGGITQTIEDMAHRLHEKRLRKEQQLLNTSENTYSNLTPNRCDNCVTEKPAMPAACALHGHSNNNPNSCAVLHSANQQPAGPPTNLNCMYQQPTAALMTHSRSLEHYQEPHATLPHRHSFEQHPKDYNALHPHGHLYEAPYDCLDGLSMGSTASYAAVAGAYNAPGNRYPLPYNISSQLNAQYATPLDGYANAEHGNANMYASIGKPTTATVPHSCGYHGNQVAAPSRQAPNVAAMAAMQHRQSTYPPDHHLIDFDERAQLMQHDFNDPRLYEPRRGALNMPRSQGVKHSMNSAVYAPSRDAVPVAYAGYDLPTTLPQSTPQDMYVYARPVPKSSRIRAQLETGEPSTLEAANWQHRHRDQLVDPMDNNRKGTHKELRERISLTAGAAADGRHHVRDRDRERERVRERDMTISDTTSYESTSLDDSAMLNSASPPLIPKVQEGVGSFESWNYVFKNLELNGYSKDLGDREDLLVQSLDLDSLTLANGGLTQKAASVDKRRPETHTQPANVEKSRSLEKKREVRVVQAPPPTPAPNSSSAGIKKVKSALKTATIDNRASGSNARTTAGRTRNSATGTVAKKPPPVSTQLIVTSPNEWSCRSCTFLNPDTKRVCGMCCHSKDFNLEAAANVSQHASSTCV